MRCERCHEGMVGVCGRFLGKDEVAELAEMKFLGAYRRAVVGEGGDGAESFSANASVRGVE